MGLVCSAATGAVYARRFKTPGVLGDACRLVMHSAGLHSLKKEGVR
jgi:hypothetical protein